MFKKWFKRIVQMRPLLLMALAATSVLLALLLFWILDKYLAFKLAESYVNEIANALDINIHLARAITVVVAVILAILTSLVFTFEKTKRWIGIGGLVALFITNSLVLWMATRNQFVDRAGSALKCYFFNGDRVEYGERSGIDPRTGRLCRAITPEILWRLREYEKGRKPQLITGRDIVFFDPRSGEPVIWFSRTRNRLIQLFDLMGFHPETGAELDPVNREIVGEWHEQYERLEKERRNRELTSRPPQRVDETGLVFFDPVTGAPKIWYWRGGDGNFEFFDNVGFHPRTGEQLKPVTREIVIEWQKQKSERERTERETREKQEREAAEALAREKERLALKERERLEREANERRIQEENDAQERRIKQEREAEQRRAREQYDIAERNRRRSVDECDRLAANPNDKRRSSEVSGVQFAVLRSHASQAIAACEEASRLFPDENRLKYQLARTFQTIDPRKAQPILRELVAANYPAAFDNLGSLFRDGRVGRVDNRLAIDYFRKGANLDDPDSMFSLAGMLNDPNVGIPSPREALYWYQKAAEMGHDEAASEVQRLYQSIEQQDRTNEMMRQLLEGFINRIRR